MLYKSLAETERFIMYYLQIGKLIGKFKGV